MYSILIVDDETEIRNGFARYFPWNEQGFSVVGTAANAQEGIEFLTKNPVDVVMTDIVMPKKSGLDFCDDIARIKPETKVIIMSGFDNFEYARNAIKQNVFAYLLKSDKHTVLIETLKRLKKALDHAQGLPAYDGSIDMVLRYIQKNYQTCSLKSIAGITRLNMNYLSTAFKMKTGTSFHEYVTAVRLKKACELLLKGEEKPNKIAQDVGYADTTVLNRVFKKKYGMGIREYQIRHRIGDLDGQP